jgi:hypothetical protein
MSANRILDRLAHIARVSLAILTALPFSLGGTLTYATPPDKDKGRENEHEPETESPIKHVIVLIGENRTFDHVFATYVPKQGELGTGAIFWSDGNGTATTGPSHIANPDPLPGTDDVYTVDLLFDGNFANCSDPTQPGIKPIGDYLKSLPYHPSPKCQPEHSYMINNDSPGFLPDGTIDTAGIAKGNSVPPTNIRTIGDALNDKGISWAY